jgi:hypothetical protein
MMRERERVRGGDEESEMGGEKRALSIWDQRPSLMSTGCVEGLEVVLDVVLLVGSKNLRLFWMLS